MLLSTFVKGCCCSKAFAITVAVDMVHIYGTIHELIRFIISETPQTFSGSLTQPPPCDVEHPGGAQVAQNLQAKVVGDVRESS